MPSNAEIAAAFTELADRMAVTESKPFRLMAYRKAADLFLSLPDSVEVLAREGRLGDLPGIGPAIVGKVDDLVERGSFDALDRARADVPDGLLQLTRVSGVGLKTAVKVWNGLDASSFGEVVAAARSGQLALVPGVGAKVVGAVLAAADADEQAAGDGGVDAPRFLRSDVDAVLDAVHQHVVAAVPDAVVHVAGEHVRGVELESGAAVVIAVDALDTATFLGALEGRGWDAMTADAELPGVALDQVRYTPVVSPSGMPVAVWWALPEALPAVLLTATGPVEHVTAVLDRVAPGVSVPAAVARRPRVTVDEPERPDDAIYAAAGLQVVPPELRDQAASLEAAATGALPELVREEQLVGELHCHSEWSDGKATILEMAVAAMERGDSYMAMTDHSAPYAMVGGLGEERLAAQAEEIAKVNAELAGAFTVLRGSEVEIGADGQLGLPDRVLARLDWAVASIHVAQKQDGETIDRRIEAAMRNPLIDVIGHPTSRRLLRRARTRLDVRRLIELAVETGTMLEINANPDRLDLDSEQARGALEAGVLLTVDSDSHRPSTLALRSHGVAVARRAGATADRIANTFSLEDLRAAQPRNRA